MQRKVTLFIAMLLIAGGASAAVDPILEDVLITGTLSPQRALTSSVSVLDSQQIKALNKTTVADLLKTLPGVLVEEQGGPGGLTAVSIRGGESNFTLVLVDGIAVNDPTNSRGGGFDFANLNPNMVDRIEVVRGAQSAIYGSAALAGVINIITRKPTQGHNQDVYVELGEHDYSEVGLSALGSLGDVNYTLELAARDDGEPVSGSSRENNSANLRLGWQPVVGHDINLGYRYIDGDRKSYPEQSGGPQYALFDEQDKSDYTQKIVYLGWAAQVSSVWRSALTANRFEAKDRYQSPGIPPYFEVPPNSANTDFTRDHLQWINSLQLAPGYSVNVGADYRHEDGQSEGFIEYFGDLNPTDFDLDRDTSGFFAGVTASPTDALLLQGSLRYDSPEGFDSETSFQAGMEYTVGSGVAVAANWGEAYKLPSFFALGHALVGNPDLKPEQGESWDLGVTWETADALRLAATVFHNDFRDLVDFDDETFRNVNRSNVQTRGLELQVDWQPLTEFSLRSQATYTDIDVKNEDTVLTGRPEWTASVVAQWHITEQLNVALDYVYTGHQWAASRYTGAEVTEELNDFGRLDWVLRWQPVAAWQVQLSADNLLNEHYETAVGFNAPQREFRIGVIFSH
ncbi:MAG: TonB-dependent receptor [Halioglobus sp.]|jgi:vitamin B12 transporter|nr:TonB-dependent receptor [Halioglobus sp.]